MQCGLIHEGPHTGADADKYRITDYTARTYNIRLRLPKDLPVVDVYFSGRILEGFTGESVLMVPPDMDVGLRKLSDLVPIFPFTLEELESKSNSISGNTRT